ncbi:shikimate kinase [Thermus thermamylovorans]|uniref:Shikimate kinase n=1 Tax=Thermus thermamylovorans TaxID=2509362 RepID=A0A4Q9AZV1_9DEIN|nr:shikimate kinase [Thermus thermamylovorans]TBH17428.1 shikimate kinase [Thermus thermamylovorans]
MTRLEVPRPATFVSLTGFMGVGKSRIGRELARALLLHFIDLDRYIERRTGLSIPDVFRHLGEEAFRRMEKEAVRELIAKDFLVLSLGGGTFVDPENRALLLARGPVVALWASPKTILERATRRPGERPLLQVENPLERIRTLLEAREAIYREAHVHVSTDGRRVEEVVEEILEKLWSHAEAKRP